MKTKLLRLMLLFVFALGLFTPAAQVSAQADSASSKGISPEGMLNADGTLNLREGFRGALDLSGYSVEIDSARGPVFGPARSVSAAVTPGNWAGVGDGGGVLTGFVKGIAVSGTDVYVVGSFTDAGNIPAADFIAKWDGTNWSALGSDSTGDGAIPSDVSSVAVANGSVYVGGSFANVKNGATTVSTASRVARWDGSTWSGLGSNGANGGAIPNGSVYAIAVDGSGNVYAGGTFTDVNNGGTVIPEADYVAKWNGSNWSALGNNGAGVGALGGIVYTLAASGADVYVGGLFTDAAGLPAADYVAKWNGANWSALGNNGAGNGSITSGYVTALAVSGTDVYVGGIFSDVNNNGSALAAADYLAKWNGTNWSALGSNGADGALNNMVYGILVNGTDVYAGGTFTNAAGLGTADYLAKWDGANWNALGNNGAGNGSMSSSSVLALAMQGSALLTGGAFYDVNDGVTLQLQADYLAQWDGTHWSSVGSAANGALINGYTGSSVNAILVNGADVYVGGRFTNLSNHGVNIPQGDNIAKWDGANWSALGSNGAGEGALNGYVNALALIGADLYVGGAFTNAAGLPEADYIAKWDGANWSALGNNGAGVGALPNMGFVNDLAVNGADLYVGGGFTNAAGLAEADYIAKWDGASWSALGSNGAGTGALGLYVSALALDASNNLYAGGGFTDAAGIAEADYIAKWDGANWTALGNSALNGGIYTLAASGTDLYAGGYFTNAAGIANADYLAKWDGTQWSAVGSSPLNGQVRALAVSGSDLFVGGIFTNAGGISAADYIAHWDGTQWIALGSDGAGNGSIKYYGSTPVYSIAPMGSDLLVGGRFSDISNNGTILPKADYIAAYGIPAYTPVTYTVNKLADTNDGTCDADCSLREAIAAAQDSDSIIFAAGLSGTITLGSQLTIAADITITGPTNLTIILSGNDATRIFDIQSGAVVQLAYLRLDHGYVLDDNGGAILNNGGLILNRVIVSNSRAESTNPSFGNGGGIYSASGANLTLTSSSQVTTNTASYSGGGIYAAVTSGATFSMSNYSTVDHNTAYQGSGGGLYLPNPGAAAAGTILIDSSAITDNGSSGGGGIFLAASATITRSSIVNNNMSAFSGGGGGMKIYEGGAGDKPITVSVTNVTVSGNNSFGQGGGVEVSLQQAADAVTFNNVTIADNHRNIIPGPPAPYGGGGFYASGAELPDMLNSIVAANTSAVGGADCEGALNSLDYNLIQDTTLCTLSGATAHNVTGVSANLSALTTVNGVKVIIPLYGSPAINAGNNATCEYQDQTGTVRSTMGGACDLGAYETDSIAPTVVSIVRASADHTSAASVDFTVTFSESMTGVDAADFTATMGGGVSGATVSGVAGSGSVYTLTVSTGAGNGSLRLDILAGAALTDLAGNPLAGLPYTAGETYAIEKDLLAPAVTSIVRASANPTSAASVNFTVTFSESVTGVDAADFALTTSGVSGATVSGVSGSGAARTVSVQTGSGNGTIRLDLKSSGTGITDALSNPISGGFTGGQVYTVKKVALFSSTGSQDGWVLESAENSNTGGTMNSTSVLRLGDDAAKKQYRSILSFNTGGLPDNAVITKITLKVKRQGVAGGGDPVTMFQGFMADIRKGVFGTSALQLTDWQATAHKSFGPFVTPVSGGWYALNLTTAKAYINKLSTNSGLTQIRLRFKLDDNNNAAANYLSLFSGDAGAASRPQLIVEYYVP